MEVSRGESVFSVASLLGSAGSVQADIDPRIRKPIDTERRCLNLCPIRMPNSVRGASTCTSMIHEIHIEGELIPWKGLAWR